MAPTLRALFAALVLVTLGAPFALAQEAPALPPAGSHDVTVGNATLAFWVGPTAGTVDEDLALGENATLWFGLVGANTSRLVVHLNVTPTSASLSIPNGSVSLDAAPGGFAAQNVTFVTTVADAGVVNQSYSFAGEVYEDTNGTLLLVGPIQGSGSFTVDVGSSVIVPVPEPGIPGLWVGLGLLALAGVVVGGIALQRRSTRRRMNEAPRRSQVMRELELEKKLDKAKEKDPEQVVQIQQEIRAAETVREKRRELQILEAKRADVHKTLDLLRKRHEAGGLSKHQFDNMAAKKQADLARIEADIAEMERQDGGSAA